MIWRNFLRDLRQTAPRLISVMVITMIAVMVYTALNGVLYHVQQVTAAYGQTQNVADYWISGAGLDRSDCRVLEQIGLFSSFDCQSCVFLLSMPARTGTRAGRTAPTH